MLTKEKIILKGKASIIPGSKTSMYDDINKDYSKPNPVNIDAWVSYLDTVKNGHITLNDNTMKSTGSSVIYTDYESNRNYIAINGGTYQGADYGIIRTASTNKS